jgi:hypothetical protein
MLQKRLFKPSTIAAGLFLLIGLLFFRPVVMTAILVAIGAVSIIYKRWVSVGIDLEMCSFCAVAVGSTYGAVAGAFSGGVSILLALILNGHAMQNPLFAAIKVVTVALLGILAAIFATGNLVLLGGVYTFIADLAFVLIALQTGGNPGNLFVGLLTHALIVVYQLNLLLPLAKVML